MVYNKLNEIMKDELSPKNFTEFQTQVSKDHYHYEFYDNVERFIDYYFQKNSIIKLNDKIDKILEVGIGNKTLTNYLKEFGFSVTTCDFAKDLKPDKVADVRKLPFDDKEFDVSVGFEVLEHIPFSDFKVALNELARVSKKYVIISLPNSVSYFEFVLKFSLPKIRDKKLHFKIQLPNFLTRHSSYEHFWELNKKDWPISKIRNIIKNCKLEIIDEFEPEMHITHHFFVMKKKNNGN